MYIYIYPLVFKYHGTSNSSKHLALWPFHPCEGLGILPGAVRRFPESKSFAVPNINWSGVAPMLYLAGSWKDWGDSVKTKSLHQTYPKNWMIGMNNIGASRVGLGRKMQLSPGVCYNDMCSSKNWKKSLDVAMHFLCLTMKMWDVSPRQDPWPLEKDQPRCYFVHSYRVPMLGTQINLRFHVHLILACRLTKKEGNLALTLGTFEHVPPPRKMPELSTVAVLSSTWGCQRMAQPLGLWPVRSMESALFALCDRASV